MFETAAGVIFGILVKGKNPARGHIVSDMYFCFLHLYRYPAHYQFQFLTKKPFLRAYFLSGLKPFLINFLRLGRHAAFGFKECYRNIYI